MAVIPSFPAENRPVMLHIVYWHNKNTDAEAHLSLLTLSRTVLGTHGEVDVALIPGDLGQNRPVLQMPLVKDDKPQAGGLLSVQYVLDTF